MEGEERGREKMEGCWGGERRKKSGELGLRFYRMKDEVKPGCQYDANSRTIQRETLKKN